MKKFELKTNENGWIYGGEIDFFFKKSYHIRRYADHINEICIPLLYDLGVNTSIKDIIRYSSKGGLKRLEKEYIKDYSGNETMKRLALSNFKQAVARHPEFHEIANAWKWVNFLKLNADGEVELDDETYQQSLQLWVKEPDCIKFIKQRVLPVIDSLNSMIDEDCDGMRYLAGIKAGLFYYDRSNHQFVLNQYNLTDRMVKTFMTKDSEVCKDSFNETFKRKEMEAEEKEVKQTIKELGLSAEESELIAATNYNH